MVGAALSRECIAHECAPTEISNMFDENVCSLVSSAIFHFSFGLTSCNLNVFSGYSYRKT